MMAFWEFTFASNAHFFGLAALLIIVCVTLVGLAQGVRK